MQFIAEYRSEDIDIPIIDFRSHKVPEQAFDDWVKEEAQLPFFKENSNLFRFVMYILNDRQCGYFVKLHHIIADGWSIHLLTNQIADHYKQFTGIQEYAGADALPFSEYIAIENNYLSSKRRLKDKAFWCDKFNIIPEDCSSVHLEVKKGCRESFILDPHTAAQWKQYVRDNEITINTFFISMFVAYFYLYLNKSELVIGTPVLNRSGKKEKGIFGMFTSTMPFRFRVEPSTSVLETFKSIQRELKECYFHQKYPYDMMIHDLKERHPHINGLMKISINYYNTALPNAINDLKVENKEFYNGCQLYDLHVIIRDWDADGALTIDIDYKTDLYCRDQINHMYGTITDIAEQMIKHPLNSILGLHVPTESDNIREEYNRTESAYPRNKLVYQLFEEYVDECPDARAVSFGSEVMTYDQLNRKANQLGRFLRSRNVGVESVVGILTRHSIETVISILAVLKTGGAYLPLDPSYPPDRIKYMLQDANVQILLVNNTSFPDNDFWGEVVHVQDSSLYNGEDRNLNVVNSPEDLAYVIYTSGSTGRPKGVMIEHRNLVNYIWWAKQVYVKAPREVFAFYSSLAFDLTVTSVFTPLLSGGEIAVYEDNAYEYVFYRIFKDKHATVVKATPSHLNLIKDKIYKESCVHTLIVGGEDLKQALAQAVYDNFDGNIRIYNEYGPTETTVGCMIHRFEPQLERAASVSIGKPSHNNRIYILDEKQRPVPTGVSGEIYISGDSVGRGYMNQPETTKDKFMEDPFNKGNRMYRTGDLGKLLASASCLEYLGRMDQQVKIRGFRVELPEIENLLLKHRNIEHVTIVDHNINGAVALVAYYVAKKDINDKDLRRFVSGQLPDYMCPLYFIRMDTMPLTPNGKIDRSALPVPEQGASDSTERLVTERGAAEHDISGLFLSVVQNILNVSQLSLKDNFYHVGGDSIKAIQIASALLDQFGLKISVRDILSFPVIEQMIDCLELNTGSVQEVLQGNIEDTPIVRWFKSQQLASPGHYMQSVVLNMKRNTDKNMLQRAVQELIRVHDGLRINLDKESGSMFYNNRHLNVPLVVGSYDLSGLSAGEQAEQMDHISFQLNRAFDLNNDLLLRVCLADLGAQRQVCMIVAHHLIIDGVSWRILLRDLDGLIGKGGAFSANSLVRTHSLKEWSDAMICRLDDLEQEEQEYWSVVAAKSASFQGDDQEVAREDDIIANCIVHEWGFSEETTLHLTTAANVRLHSSMNELLLLSFIRTMNDLTGELDIVFELEGHGRDGLDTDIDLSRTVGWFTSIYPVRITLGSGSLQNQLGELRDQLQAIPNKGNGFGLLQYHKGLFTGTCQKYIRFNYLGDLALDMDSFDLDLTKRKYENHPGNQCTSLMDINIYIINRRLFTEICYNHKRYTMKSIHRLAAIFKENIERIAQWGADSGAAGRRSNLDFHSVDLTQDEVNYILDSL